MTRPLSALSVFLLLVCPAAALAQTKANPGAASRYAPPAATQAAPARPASDVRPIMQPGGVAPGPVAQPAVVPPLPQPPEWAARMSPEEQKWIDEVLKYWESRSEKVKTFECKFQKWDYDGGFVDANQKRHPRTFAEGVIKYAQPDKALFHVENLVSVMPPANPGGKPEEIVQNADLGEHWICDGEKVYSFEANKKQVTVTPLPPEMRGKAIADGPLPFMFGARAQTIQARYWIHGLPDAPPDKYWLEAVPKSREDAQNFKQVRIRLDKQDYLPELLQIFPPNYDPPRNDAHQTYVFTARVTKDEATLADMVKKGLDPFGLIRRDFFEPRIPTGWKKVVQNGVGNVPAGPPQQAGPAPPPRQPGAVQR